MRIYESVPEIDTIANCLLKNVIMKWYLRNGSEQFRF